MTPAPPDRRFLAAQVRWAMGRGLPAQDAEDVVFEAYHRAVEGFDPSRGSFEAYMQTIVRTSCAYWWRSTARHDRAVGHLRLLPSPTSSDREERAARHQEQLLAALSDEERKVFAAWALQKHLGKGRITSREVSRAMGMAPSAYDNAKRRLRTRLQRLLERFGWTATDLLYGETDVDQVG